MLDIDSTDDPTHGQQQFSLFNEDANDADHLRHDPALQIVTDQKLEEPLGSQPTLSRWENAPSARSLVELNGGYNQHMYHPC